MHRGTIAVRIIVVYSVGKFDTRQHVTAVLLPRFRSCVFALRRCIVHQARSRDG